VKVALHAGQLLQPVPGGVGRYVRALLHHLPSVDVDVMAFATGAEPAYLRERVGWTDIGWPRGPLRYECWHRLRRPLVRVPGDVLHAPSLAVPPPGRRPLVVTVHDIAFRRFPAATTPRGRRFHERGLDLARRDADMVIVPSVFTRDELVREGFDRARVRVIPHGFDPPMRRSDNEIDDIVRHAGVAPPYLLAVGTIEPRKNLTRLVAAYEQVRTTHPTLRLLLVGPPGWGDVEGLDRPGVSRFGSIPWPVLDALYRRCTACCLVSSYEGFGLPAIEALARRAPLVASNNSAIAEAVGSAAVLVDPEDVDAIAAAIARVVDDEALRGSLGDQGVERASEFTWSHAAALHADAYTAALTGALPPRS
jgi:glycosyltransferase involved in cell wall biosynthesis